MSGTIVVQMPIKAEDMPLSEDKIEKIKAKLLEAARIQWGDDAEVEVLAQFRGIPGFKKDFAQVAEFQMWVVEE